MRLPAAIFVATQPVNLRLSFDRLAGLVREQLRRDPRSDALFVFHNKRKTHLKLIWHDGSGYRILYKRLDRGQGRFRIPLPIPENAAQVSISRRELTVLLEGINMTVVRSARRAGRTA